MKIKKYDHLTIGKDGKRYYYLDGKRIPAPKGLTKSPYVASKEIPEFWAKVFNGFRNFLKSPWA